MEYKPLDFTTFEFRLLTILPLEDGDGDQDKTIRCSLSHSLLIEPPEYHALSYCWGDPGSTATIIVNGNPTRVTKNLETALWELRYRQIQTIWVDALCINQNDLVERGLQVPRMGLIYSRAVEVIVWLGGEADDSKKAMACLKQVSRSNFPKAAGAIKSLLMRPFWTRVWIIQEVSKARKLTVLCGTQRIAWEHMFDALEKWNLVPPAIKALQRFRKADQSFMGIDRPKLIQGLFETIHSQSTDPRDKIFAILGLCSDGQYLVQSPNYVQSPTRVYFDLLMAMVSRDQKLSYMAREGSIFGNLKSNDVSHPNWMNITHGITFWVLTALYCNETISKSDEGYPEEENTMYGTKFDPMANDCLPLTRHVRKAGQEDFPSLSFSGLRASVVILDSISRLENSQEKKSIANEILNKVPKPTIHEARDVMQCFGNALLLRSFSRSGLPYVPEPKVVATAMTFLCKLSNLKVKFAKRHRKTIPAFALWYRANRDLKFRGYTLKEWKRIYAASSEYKFAAFGTPKHNHSMQNPGRDIVQYFRSMANGIRWVIAHNLCLATGYETQILQLVPCEVRQGDLICRIRYSKAPIFLRRTEDDKYEFISICRASPWLSRDLSKHKWRALVSVWEWDWTKGFIECGKKSANNRKKANGGNHVWEIITIC